MADIFDQASDREQMDRDLAIKRQLATAPKALQRTGRCHNCDDQLTTEGLFCDTDCRDDHELRQRAKRF